MKLSAAFIAQECLNNYEISENIEPNECRLTGIRFWTAREKTVFDGSPEFLYILLDPDAVCPTPGEKGTGIFLLRSSQKPDLHAEHQGYIAVPDDSSLPDIADRIQELFRIFTDWYRELYDACILGSSLQELINITDKMTPNHVYISDMSFKVIAYTEREIMQEISPTWNYQIKYGYYPLRIIRGLIDSGDLERMKHCPKPVLFNSQNFAVPFTCKTIYFANRPQAHLFVVNCMKRPCARDYVIAELLGEFINKYYYLLPEARPDTTEKYYEAFLDDTRRGVITDPDVIQEQIRSLGWTMNADYCMAVLDVTNRDTAFVQLVRYYLEKNREYVYFISEGYLVILITSPSAERPVLKRHLQELSKSYTLDVCLGFAYTGFLVMREQFDILVRMLKIARHYDPQIHFVEAQKYSIHYIVDYLSHSSQFSLLASSVVSELSRYDEIHGTAYFDTLNMYLSCSCNVIRTAEKLHIHRNTLMYRMGKIHDLVEFDEESASDRLYIQLSLLAHRHEEIMKEGEAW